MTRTVASLIAIAWLTLGSVSAKAANAAKGSPNNNAGTDYCTQTGGVVQIRRAAFGTNGSNPLPLAGVRQFCVYTAADSSRIHLLVDTLFTPHPTLAALAYYAMVQPTGQCTGNPASCYCTQLGGTDLFGGINASGGGWFLKGDVDETLEACIFPDESSIDSWGLFYHSAGIVRGIDLATVLKYPNPY